MTKPELVLDEKAILGEGPSWDAANGRLIWVDIMGYKVHLYDPSTGQDRSIDVGQPVGAAVPAAGGDIIVALKQGFQRLNPETGQLTPIHDPEPGLPNNRFNDGKVDALGRFWAGTMNMKEGAEKETGSLYCLHADGRVTKHLDKVTTSNGLAWTSDGKTMYYIDSELPRVDAFDFDPITGELTNRRTVIRIPDGEGVPDGMTIDAEGNLWVAQWGGYQVSHWNPRTGEKLGSIPIPAPQVSSCVFAGPELDEMYITTARIGLKDDVLEQYPFAGGLFRVKLNVKGTQTHVYSGDQA